MSATEHKKAVDGRVLRAQRRRERTKLELLGAAARCFSRHGYHKTSIKHILEEAGMARGTFYLHFKSKHEVFDELMEDLVAAIVGSLPRVSVEPGAPPVADQLEDNMTRLFGALLSRREMMLILSRGLVGGDDELAGRMDGLSETVATLVTHSLEIGITMGLIRDVPRRAAALSVIGAVKEVLVSVITDPATDEEALRILVRDLVDVQLGGLAPP